MKKEKKNTSSKVNEKQEDIPNSDKEKNEEFPGYPLYPESDDIMSPHHSQSKVPLEEGDDETMNKIPKTVKASSALLSEKPVTLNKKTLPGDADITKEDLKNLGTEELNNDGGADDDLKDRTHPVDMSGEDLDIPGAELDDQDESIGEEDEENNSYSIGGDRHEDLEENTGKE